MRSNPNPRSLDAIAERLRATREAFGLGQCEFPRRAGISGSDYKKYEQAKNLLKLDFANQICDEYGVTLSWIYRGDVDGLPLHLANLLAKDQPSK